MPLGAVAAAPELDSPEALLARISKAVQLQNTADILKDLKSLARHPRPIEVADALRSLSPAAFSEIVRSLEPSRLGANADATHGLRLQPGIGQFSAVASVADQYGVRKIYKDAFQSLTIILGLRCYHGRKPSFSDYMVLLKCAGASSNVEAAKIVWHTMMKGENVTSRHGLAYTEFFKVRFLTEPMYIQNDLALYRLRQRNASGRRKRFARTNAFYPLERLRMAISVNKRESYGRASWSPTHDLHRLLSIPRPIRRIEKYIVRHGKVVDEDFLCTYLIASAQAGSFKAMIGVLWRVWKIRIDDIRDHRNATIAGGVEISDPLFKPTERLLGAVVHAFGSMGNVLLAGKLMHFISQRYRITIPPETWSLLLEWTYVHSTTPATKEWKIMLDPNRAVRAEDALSVWETMVSEPYSIKPNFKDTDIHVKSLIGAGRLGEAWDAIQSNRAEYDSLVAEVERCFFETMYPSPPPSSISRHKRLQAKQHTTWYSIHSWCHQWLREAGNRLRLQPEASARIIPQFVDELREFLSDPITYTTPGGTVRIANEDVNRKARWAMRIVRSPPTLLRVPDRSRPKAVDPQIADGDEVRIKSQLEEAHMLSYDNMPIMIRRNTKRM
ncbi:hypothetical protein CCHL11_08754 [Colletotrichum chlorophyti]|uniref:Uncharacterized protein n=1 Tax=Colletotrichum chlorophyti TaxID=708187 RepID=A0A1Q8REL0_9PEZI|nr:hypothetical protein CCHL11_08754 [Colletotrichum chlorophyti]